MTLRLSTEFNQCHSISDHNNTLACISTNTPGLPDKMVKRFNAFEPGGAVGELMMAVEDVIETLGMIDCPARGSFHVDQLLSTLARTKEASHA